MNYLLPLQCLLFFNAIVFKQKGSGGSTFNAKERLLEMRHTEWEKQAVDLEQEWTEAVCSALGCAHGKLNSELHCIINPGQLAAIQGRLKLNSKGIWRQTGQPL